MKSKIFTPKARLLIALICALALMLSLSACGKGSQGSGEGNSLSSPGETCEHNYSAAVTVPSCLEQGYTIYTCKCGNSYVGDYVDALGHDYVDGVCSRCGDEVLAETDSAYFEFALLGDNTYEIVNHKEGLPSEVVLPSSYNGKPINSIGKDAFILSSNLTSIVISDSIISIGEGAFSLNSNLTSVVIGSSVSAINETAFLLCDGLTSISVNENNKTYKSIDGNLFTHDGSVLIQYAIGKTDAAFEIPSSVITIGNEAFSFCEGLASIVISGSVTTIGMDAFSMCDGLTSVVIGDSVITIGEGSFSMCGSLSSVVIGNSVTSIGGGAFMMCGGVTSIAIPDSVTHIGEGAFNYCFGLTSITVGENNKNYKSIDGSLYGYDGTVLIQYAIGKTDSAFEIPSSVTTINKAAFALCEGLTSIEIGNLVTTIGGEAFYGCMGLTSVVIGDSVTSIGDSAFEYCNGLGAVYYNGTESEWSEISIGSANSELTSATRYYYSESQPEESGKYWHYGEKGEIVVW